MWPPNVSTGPGPVYGRVADAIAAAIKAGVLKPGSRLPSHRDMAYQLGVAVGSVARAYGLLAERGLVRGMVGHGTVVQALRDDDWISLTPDNVAVDMRLIVPPPLDDAELEEAAGRRTLADIAAHWPLLDLGGFPPDGGIDRQLKAAAAWLRARGVPASPETVFVTNGGQEALLAIVMTVARGGATILAEALTVVAIKNLAFTLGAALRGLAMDERGVLPEALDEAAGRSGARLLLLYPSLQVPTAAQMDLERRQRIAELARRHDLMIVEFGTYADFVGGEKTPFAALAPERAFFITSLSNDTYPGLRCGFLHAPPASVPRVAASRHALLLATPPLIGEIACAWIQSGVAERLIAAHRAELEARHEIVAEVLAGLPVVTRHGAPFVWLPLPDQRAGDVAARAAANGAQVLPADRFAVNKGDLPDAVRIAISSPRERSALRRGLEIVREIATRPA